MQTGEIILYKTEDDQFNVEVRLKKDTVWLRQEQKAQLFERDRTAITKHISNIFKEQ